MFLLKMESSLAINGLLLLLTLSGQWNFVEIPLVVWYLQLL